MATIAGLLAQYRGARADALAILESSPVLAEKWTVRPAAGGEGEEGWSPSEIGSHMVYGEWWMMDGAINAALEAGAGPIESQLRLAANEVAAFHARMRRLQQGNLRLPGPQETAQALAITGEQSDKLLQLLSDEHLALVTETPNGAAGLRNVPRSVEERIQAAIKHTADHVIQLKDFLG